MADENTPVFTYGDEAPPPGGFTYGDEVSIPEPVKTSQPLQGRVEIKDAFDYVAKGFQFSHHDAISASGWYDALRGEISEEDALAKFSLNQIQQNELNGLNDYEKNHYWSPEHVVKEIIGLTPYLMQNIQDAAPIIGGATLAGAGGGAIKGATIGAVTGSFTPAFSGEPITIPAGAAAGTIEGAVTGFTLGARTGLTYASGRLAAGALYRDLRAKGVPKDTAAHSAIAMGAISGTIQGWQYSRIPRMVQSAIGRQEIQKTAMQIAAKIAGEIGIQVAAGDIQEFSKIVIEVAMASLNVSQKEIKDRMIDATVKGFMGLGVPILAAHAAGALLNKSASKATPGNHVANAAALLQDALTTNKDIENVKLLRLKAEHKVAKAEESLASAKQKYDDLVSEGKPIGAAKLEIEIAKEELKQAKSELPMASLVAPPKLQGKVEVEVNSEEIKRREHEEKLKEANRVFKEARHTFDDVSEKLQDAVASNKKKRKESSMIDVGPIEKELAIAKEALDAARDARTKLEYDASKEGILHAAEDRIKDADYAVSEIEFRLQEARDADPNQDLSGLEALLIRAKKELRHTRMLRANAEYNFVNEQIDKVIEAVNSHFQQEKNQSIQKDIKENQTIVTDFIRKSPIEKRFQAPFISAVKRTQTQEQLVKVVDGYTTEKGNRIEGVRPQIKNIIAEQDRISAHRELRAVLDYVKADSNSKYRKSKFTADIQDAISKYEEYANNELLRYQSSKWEEGAPTAAEKRLQESNEIKFNAARAKDVALIDGDMPNPDSVLERELVDIIAGDTLIDYNDPEAVRNLADKIYEIATVGRNKLINKKQQELKALSQLVSDLFEDIQGEKKHHIDITEPTPKRISKTEELARIGGAKLMTLNTMFGHITQHSINPKTLDRLNVTLDLIATDNAIADEQVRSLGIILKDDKEVYKEAMKIVQEGNDKKYDWGSWTSWRYVKDENGNVVKDADGKPLTESVTQEYRASKGEVIQDMMNMTNAASDATDVNGKPKMYKGMAYGSKFTFENPEKNPHQLQPGEKSFEALLGEISLEKPYLKKIAQGGLEYFNDGETYRQINEHHRNEFGYNAPKVKLYTGPANRDGLVYTAGSNAERLASGMSNNTKRTLIPGSVIEVVQSEKPYVRTNFFNNLDRFIHDTQTWIHMRDAERKLTYAFSRPEIRKLIELKFEAEGGDARKIIDNLYSSTVGTRAVQHAQKVAWLDGLRAKIGPAFTYGKPLNFAGQISSILQTMNYITVDEFKAGIEEAHSNPQEVLKTMLALPGYQTRYRTLATELAERRQQQGVFGEKLDPKLIQATGLGLTLGDKYVFIVGGYAVRKAYISRKLAEGKSLKEATEYGDYMAQRAINETQGSALADQMTQWERGGSVHKAMVMFGKPVIQQHNATILAMRRVLANPGSGKNRDEFGRILLAHMLAGAIFTAWQTGTNLVWKSLQGVAENKDVVDAMNKVSRAFFFPSTQLPLIGDILDFSLDHIQIKVEKNLELFPPEDMPKEKSLRDFNPQFLPYKILTSGAKTILKTYDMMEHAAKGEPITDKEVYSAALDLLQSWMLLYTSAPLTPILKFSKPFWVDIDKKQTPGGMQL